MKNNNKRTELINSIRKDVAVIITAFILGVGLANFAKLGNLDLVASAVIYGCLLSL